MWDLIVSVPDHCLSFYFEKLITTTHIKSSITLTAFFMSVMFTDIISERI